MQIERVCAFECVLDGYVVEWLNGWNQKSGTYLAYVELAFFIEKLFWLGNTKRCTHCKQRIP